MRSIFAAVSVLALAAALVFALRDTLVSWVAVDSDASPELAISATLLAGTLTILLAVLVGRRRLSMRALPSFLPARLRMAVPRGSTQPGARLASARTGWNWATSMAGVGAMASDIAS